MFGKVYQVELQHYNVEYDSLNVIRILTLCRRGDIYSVEDSYKQDGAIFLGCSWEELEEEGYRIVTYPVRNAHFHISKR